MADTGQMRFSVAIPTLARPESLRETLDSVLACDPPAGEVIVVDADPEESGAAVAASYGDRVRVLPSPRGLTIQRNRALDAAAGDVVVFLDDDVQVEQGCSRVSLPPSATRRSSPRPVASWSRTSGGAGARAPSSEASSSAARKDVSPGRATLAGSRESIVRPTSSSCKAAS